MVFNTTEGCEGLNCELNANCKFFGEQKNRKNINYKPFVN
jgi:hypothetical protein